MDSNSKKKILIVEDQFIEAHDLQLIIEKAGHEVVGIARSVVQAVEFLERVKPDLVFLDIILKGNETGIDLAKRLQENHIGFVYISANSSKSILEEAKKTQPYGFIVKPFREQDVVITLEIACYRHKHSLESLLLQQNVLQKNIESIAKNAHKWEQAITDFGAAIQPHIPFDYMECGLMESASDTIETIGLLRKNLDEYQVIASDKLAKIAGLQKSELLRMYQNSPKTESPQFCDHQALADGCRESPLLRLITSTFGIKSFLVFPLKTEEGTVFHFCFYSRQPVTYEAAHVDLLSGLKETLRRLVSSNANSVKTSTSIPKAVAEAIRVEPISFGSMIGNSDKMRSVFDLIRRVAPTETSVLILGESGTGKEKVAQSIHSLSARKNKPLVTINCGAIPDNLSESLLFGHEKGAFTGAVDKRIGKFELADGGTIFLDEIGEMPMELQVKLLRVLQEKEIERIGGQSPIRIDVRIIAATNRNLEEEVAAGRFRLDLYYRLHVFPITVPSLRERKEDIPDLASHFLKLYAIPDGKGLSLSSGVLQQFDFYDWPGNIRELEHVIQRGILLAEGNTIKEIQLPSLHKKEKAEGETYLIKTIHENERDYICYILKKCKGKVSGVGGAAEVLNIPPSTLNSKIKKLGIKNNFFG